MTCNSVRISLKNCLLFVCHFLFFFFPAADHSGPIDEGKPLANAIRSDSAIIGGNRDSNNSIGNFFPNYASVNDEVKLV